MAVRKYLPCLCLLFLLAFVVTVSADRKTLDMIYKDIVHFSPCVRRFNRLGQTGCSSDMNGNTGVLHYIQSKENITWLLDNGPHEPYIPILSPQIFTLDTINALMNSTKEINGILVIHTNLYENVTDEDFSFSPDQSCPNKGFGHGSCDFKWNKPGTNLFARDFNIPIFALTDDDEIESILDCYNDRNIPINGQAREYPLCAVELIDFMYGAVDTETCMRRSTNPTNIESIIYCDPLSDANVWGMLNPTNKDTPLKNKSMIVTAAPLDSTSLFYNVTPEAGAELAATSFITLLSTAYALGRLTVEERNQLDKNIIFEFFHGESYDYIGSSRTVFDMKRGRYPVKHKKGTDQPALLKLEHIAMFLEFRQLGLPENQAYFMHQDNNSKTETTNFINNLKSGFSSTDVRLEEAPTDRGLPPASFQSFLREDSSIPGVVLADHQTYYNNRFYNSRFEIAAYLGLNFTNENETDSILTENLTNVATGAAKALYLEAGGKATDSVYNKIEADLNITGQLIYCFLYRPTCSLFKSVVDEIDSTALSEIPYQFYIGVHRGGGHSNFVSLVQKLLSYFIALDIKDSNSTEAENCKNEDDSELYDYSYMQGPDGSGICVKSATGLAIAVSPAFIDDEKDFPQWTSNYYSTWTESAWNSYSARLFLKPSKQQESLIFSVGMIIVLLSFPFIYFLNVKGSAIFNRD